MHTLLMLFSQVIIQQAGGLLEIVSDWAAELMNVLGGPGLALAIALELPSEAILPLAGFVASRPNARFTLVEAVIWATIGAVVGAIALYWLGRALGHDRTVRVLRKIPFVSEHEVVRAMESFKKHGGKAVFFCRMVPVLRGLISIPAGIEKMPQWKFIGLTAAGSLIWNIIWIVPGYLLGERWQDILKYSSVIEKAIIAVMMLFVAWWVTKRVIRYRKQKRAAEELRTETDGIVSAEASAAASAETDADAAASPVSVAADAKSAAPKASATTATEPIIDYDATGAINTDATSAADTKSSTVTNRSDDANH